MKTNHYEILFEYIEKLINAKVPEKEKREIIRTFKPRKLNKKDFFIKEGDIPACIAFNVTGLLRCYYIDNNGNDVTKYFCFEGSMLSYLGLVLRKESKYYIEALEDCLLLYADYDSFENLINNSYFALIIIKTFLEQTLIYKEERESSFLLENATERYINLVNAFPDIEQRVNLGYIASYLGVSQVSLSRIRKKLNII
ncbi:MAG: Crp/Fnr family transcriptional regulator [Bacilli bacterium]|nr:Crp/Fnr family transcriptional regulator [Bacilli bacterium]HPR92974.1 Crp/Fnr family transcriptional regulator [Syntrophomonadaceae bacterium]